MGDYERTVQVDVPAKRLFDYLADVGNLPRYFARMTSAERTGPEEVAVVANVQGEAVAGKAWLRADPERMHLDWGAESASDYHGRLDVIEAAEGAGCSVTMLLHTGQVDSAAVESGLRETLDTIKRLVEEPIGQPLP
jgi:uncharacterized membrane protein